MVGLVPTVPRTKEATRSVASLVQEPGQILVVQCTGFRGKGIGLYFGELAAILLQAAVRQVEDV